MADITKLERIAKKFTEAVKREATARNNIETYTKQLAEAAEAVENLERELKEETLRVRTGTEKIAAPDEAA